MNTRKRVMVFGLEGLPTFLGKPIAGEIKVPVYKVKEACEDWGCRGKISYTLYPDDERDTIISKTFVSISKRVLAKEGIQVNL